ncbi:MAG: OmpA family protein [Deltaproteobacteria bacterium]|nr:OmpA family protein [Deltaproteobacteria bacterium]
MRRPLQTAALALLVALAWSMPVGVTRAEEPWLLHLDANLAVPMGQPQSDLFGPGLGAAASLERSLVPWVSVGARVRGLFLFDGPAPMQTGRADPGMGTLATLSGVVRLRPLASGGDPRRGTGLWLDLAGGGGFTGSSLRSSFEIGAGYGFAWGDYDIGPSVRYVQVIEPNSGGLDDRDARLLLVGLRVTLFDARPEAAPPPPPTPGDRDFDRILDPDDACPDEPEDYDGFEDVDGCPDPDNDQDGILDPDDECPDEAEDVDGFEDEDGCPDPDNDQDSFLDPDDECPDEAEVINGVDDDDGCPDEGLIEMVDDRIILEERVLFDFERARVKHEASPMLLAIVNLIAQHPEWSRLRVEGHADIRGVETYNQRLSERRARNVMRALVRLGVDRDIISSVGYGSTHPRDLHRTELAHQRNRRVEFVVLERHPAPGQASAELTSDEPAAGPEASPADGESPTEAVAAQTPDESDSEAAPAANADPADGGSSAESAPGGESETPTESAPESAVTP